MTSEQILIQKVRELLNRNKYHVFDNTSPEVDMSFDFIARHQSNSEITLNILIKVVENIDNIKPHYFNELKLISKLIAAIPLFVGTVNRHSVLRNDSIYLRNDIVSINFKTFEKIMLHPDSSFALAFAKQGGFFHELDSDQILKLRKKKGFSRKTLAEKVNVSSKSIAHYEKHGMRASVENAANLEKSLGASVIKHLNFFKILEDTIFNLSLDCSLQKRISAKTEEFIKSINEIIEDTGYQSFWPKAVPFDLFVYKKDDDTNQIKEYTLVGGAQCEEVSNETDDCKQQEFLHNIPQDNAIIYDEEIYNEKTAKKRAIPYLIPKELKKLENPEEFKKLIQRRKKIIYK